VAINKEWHRSHRMPLKATREQRVAWHAAHKAACGCRDIPASLRPEVIKLLRSRPKPFAAEPPQAVSRKAGRVS